MTTHRGDWLAPLHRSRAGAAHLRRQTPCQDSALSGTARSRDGLSVQLMAVADGHGGSAYWLSEVGSHLACSLALEVAAEGISRRLLDRPLDNRSRDALTQWLSLELPATLHQRWLAAVSADWQQRPDAEGQPPRPYGTTLGLVLLTPHWWAHTGLGDWDLVLLEQGEARLVSEERAAAGSGEATASLCLEDAAQRFSERCGLQALPPPHGGSLSLVLSTDGIRKSCATDSDHLALCRFLAEASEPLEQTGQRGETDQLDDSLDRISREGSGDDVSAAIAHYRPSTTAPAPARAREGRRQGGPGDGPGNSRRRSGSNGRKTGLLTGGGLVVVLAGAGLTLLGRAPQPRPSAPTAARPPVAAAAVPMALVRQVQQLCEPPAAALIEATLNQRKALFAQLAQSPPLGTTTSTTGTPDSTDNALTRPATTAGAASGAGTGPEPPGANATAGSPGIAGGTGPQGGDALGELIRRSQPAAGSTVITTTALPPLCPELAAALQRRWRLQAAAPASLDPPMPP